MILLTAFLTVRSQPAKTPETISASARETVFVHINTASLLAGEVLYCKVYCLDPADKKISPISKIAYVQLIGNDLKPVFSRKLYLENGTAQGDFFIPASIKSGNYKLIVYTKQMLNQSALDFSATDLFIINPFERFGGKTDSLQHSAKPQVRESSLLSATIDRKTYSKREKISLKIAPAQNGNYSVSVRKVDGLPAPAMVDPEDFNPSVYPARSDNNQLPELRGEMITGNIISKKGKNTGNKSVALSIPGKSFLFKIVQTDSKGRFIFNLDRYPDQSEAIIQVMETDRQDYAIELDENKKPDFSKLSFSNINLNPSLKEEIEQRSIANQIENAYYDRKKDSILAVPEPTPFFAPLQKEYVLDDYTRFPTLKETIVEVLKELYFTRDNGHYTIHLRNMTMDAEVYGLPLILVDGLPIQDLDPLFDYGMKYVYKVGVINEPYVYGPRTFSGVISFTTKLQDFTSIGSGDYIRKFTLDRPMRDKTYFHQEYNDKTPNRIPDYRHQLLWLPELDNSDTVTFFTSDVSGMFEISVEGFTQDGKPVTVTQVFEVK